MHGAPKYSPEAAHLDYVNPDAPKGGMLKMAAIGTFDTLNPFTLKGKAAEGLNLIYDRLMARVWDEPFTLYPLIAAHIDVPEDRSSLTVHIDPRARFQDGAKVTADDVIFSFETLRDYGRPNMRRVYKLVAKTEKIDDLSVKFSFSADHDRETVMILAMMPVLAKHGWAGKNFDAATLTPPPASGPYRIKTIDPGRRIVYERDANYWARDLFVNKGQYNFDQVVYDYYRDDTVALEGFKAGNETLRREFDAGKWAGGYDGAALKNGLAIKEEFKHGRPEKTKAFIFNTRRPPFDDIRVRQALELLFDFEWVNRNLFHGTYKRIESIYPNAALADGAYKAPRNATPEQRRANMRIADRLLNEAGWNIVNGARMKNGKPFTFEIILSAPEDEKIALNFQRTLHRIGINPAIRVLDNAAYIGRLNDYDFDMTLYYWLSTLSPGTEQVLYWGCQAGKEKGRWNYPGICDPAIDSLASAIARSQDREGLVESARALDRKIMQGHYMIPLYYAGEDDIAYWKPIRHPGRTPLYGPVIESWWMGP